MPSISRRTAALSAVQAKRRGVKGFRNSSRAMLGNRKLAAPGSGASAPLNAANRRGATIPSRHIRARIAAPAE